MSKITDLETLSKLRVDWRSNGSTVVLCHGVFDLLHIGHLRHLEAASKLGDILVVTVTPDRFVNKGYNRPAFNEHIRAEAIASLVYVDYVAVNQWSDAVKTIKYIKPDVYAKGKRSIDASKTYMDALKREEEAVTSCGGKFVTTDELTFSSTRLINRYMSAITDEALSYIDVLSENYTGADVVSFLDNIRDMSILIIGEAVIDEYCYGRTIGKSNKAPMLVFSTDRVERHAGVPLNIANNLSGFCDNVKLVAMVGNDWEKVIEDGLDNRVKFLPVIRQGANTITKRRYVNEYPIGSVFEVYEFDSSPVRSGLINSSFDDAAKYDLVLVCDSGHGMLNKEARSYLIKKSKYLAVNTQMNAGNTGRHSLRKYFKRKGNQLFCVNEREFILAMHEQLEDYHSIDEAVEKFPGDIIVTRGPNGCVGKIGGRVATVPAMVNNVIDPVGAGDAFLSVVAPLACNNAPVEIVLFCGSVFASIATTYIGNKVSIEHDKICKFIEGLFK